MAKKIVIDIQTQANVAQINKMIKSLDSLASSLAKTAKISPATKLAESIKGLSKSIDTLSASNREVVKTHAAAAKAAATQSTATTKTQSVLQKFNATVQQNQAALKQQQAAFLTSGKQIGIWGAGIRLGTQATQTFGAATSASSKMMTALNAAVRIASAVTSAYGKATSAVNTILRGAMTVLQALARTLGTVLSAALKAASTAFTTLGRTAGAVFSGLSRALNGVSNTAKSFAGAITSHMNTATRSVKNFYNAGWSLLTTGYLAKAAGGNILGGAFGGLGQFMDYEKLLTRAAVAGGQDPQELEKIIFGLQRGTIGKAPIKGFGADEIAQAMYFYSSAIGTAVTEANADVVSTILQMASVTQTSVETATKGIVNIAQEFGIDPRSADSSEAMQNIAAQVAYIANATTLEVPDIIESFKYIGPLAHVLSPKGAGSGLNETLVLTQLQSELGLRGGQAGRGVGQLLNTILDPTAPAIEAAAEAFGIGASKTAWDAFFLDSEGNLQGGLQGLFEKLGSIPEEKLPAMLTALFTTNASRSAIAATEAALGDALKSKGGWAGLMKDIGSQAPMDWLTEAVAKTNDSIFASFQNLKNAWFAVQTEIIRSVQGPLTKAMNMFSDIIWKISDIIRDNKWIGELVMGVLTVVGVVLSLIGAFFMLGGSILLVMKAFVMLGGLFTPAVFFLITMASALAVLIPLMVALAAAAVIVQHAWDTNFKGIQDRVDDVITKIREWAQWAETYGPAAAQAFRDVFSEKVFEQLARFQMWVQKNREELIALKNLGIDLVKDALKGFAVTLTVIVGAIVKFVEMIAKAPRALAQLISKLTGTQVSVEDLAHAISFGLGAALATFLFVHLTPGIGMLGNFTAKLVALGAAALATGARIAAMTAQIIGQSAAWVVTTGVQTLATFATRLYGLVQKAVTATTAALTAGSFSLSLTLSALLSVMIAIGAVALTLAAAITLVVAGALVYVAVTQGLNAALQDARSFIDGVLSVLIPMAEAARTVVGAIVVLIAKLLSLIDITMSFHTAGVMVGVLLGVVLLDAALGAAAAFAAIGVAAAAAAASFVAWLVVLIATNLPLVAIVAAIGLVLLALNKLGVLDDIFHALGTSVDWLADKFTALGKGVKAAFFGVKEDLKAVQAEMMTTQRAIAVNESVVHNADLTRLVKERGDIYKDQGVGDPYGRAAVEINKELHDQAANAWNMAQGGYVDFTQKTPEGIAITRRLDPIQQLTDPAYLRSLETKSESAGQAAAKEVADGYTTGFVGDVLRKLHLDNLVESLGFDPDNLKLSDLTKSLGMDQMEKVLKDFGTQTLPKTLEEVKQHIQEYMDWEKLVAAVGRPLAEEMYHSLGQDIPIPPTLGEYAQAQQEAADEIAKTQQEVIDQNEAFRQKLMAGFDLPKAISYKFDTGKGPGYLGVGGAIAQYADAFTANIPEGAVWSNIYEGLADVIGMGGGDVNVYGKNLHTLLANNPGFQNWAAEMGKSVDEMLKDVPTFVHAEEFVPMAFAEIMDAIPKSMYDQLDTLGADIGKGIEGAGLNWQELAQFAVSQAQAGDFDWNLTDYLMEAWDMTREQVELYLQDHPVDPNIVTGATFPDLKLMLESKGGAINVFNDEWYAWYQEQLADVTPNIIELTQAAFDNMPESIKISMSSMGFVFHITDTPYAELDEESQAKIRQAYIDLYTKDPHNYFDYSGELPTPKTAVQFKDDTSGLTMPTLETPTTEMPGLPAPPDYVPAVQAIVTVIAETFNTELPNIAVAATVFDEKFKGIATSAAEAFKTQLGIEMASGLDPTSAGTGGEASVGGAAVGPSSGPYDAIFKLYAGTAADAFSTQVDTSLHDNMLTSAANLTISLANPFGLTFTMWGNKAVTAFGVGLQLMGLTVSLQLDAVLGIISSYSSSGYNTAYNLGYNIGLGLKSGLDSQLAAVQAAASSLVSAAHAGGEATAEVGSPSRLFARLGEHIGEGLAVGTLSSIQMNSDAMRTVVSAMSSATEPRDALGSHDIGYLSRNDRYTRSAATSTNGDVHITVHIAKMEKDVDLNNALAKLDVLQGRKVEKARRGMIPVDTQRSM